MHKLFLVFILFSSITKSQITFSEETIDLGTIEEASEIKGDIIISNTTEKKIFLMRADADRGVKIYTSKKTLQPNDTCLLSISFIPEKSGKFKKNIHLVSTDKATPYELQLSGNIKRVKTNDRMACVYFGKRKHSPTPLKEDPIFIPQHDVAIEKPNKLPNNSEKPTTPVVTELEPQQEKKESKGDFSVSEYKPNNILFLVDISSSMRDSLKLPLMKIALHKLIEEVREIDTITFVTYATKFKVLNEAVSGTKKQILHSMVDSLKARGMTSGKTAILFSQQLSQKHFIPNGNNQIIIASDGEFKFEKEDFQTWKKNQAKKEIILSTVAFGKEKKAIRNLREIAHKGGGSFIHIEQRAGSENSLLNEIKMRSKI
jgi:Mg-chelatase subunit ChlD